MRDSTTIHVSGISPRIRRHARRSFFTAVIDRKMCPCLVHQSRPAQGASLSMKSPVFVSTMRLGCICSNQFLGRSLDLGGEFEQPLGAAEEVFVAVHAWALTWTNERAGHYPRRPPAYRAGARGTRGVGGALAAVLRAF